MAQNSAFKNYLPLAAEKGGTVQNLNVSNSKFATSLLIFHRWKDSNLYYLK